jgi:hypothetical protein
MVPVFLFVVLGLNLDTGVSHADCETLRSRKPASPRDVAGRRLRMSRSLPSDCFPVI